MIIKIYFDCFSFNYYLRNVKYVFMYLKKNEIIKEDLITSLRFLLNVLNADSNGYHYHYIFDYPRKNNNFSVIFLSSYSFKAC